MKYIVTINNKNYEVEVEKGQASIVKTTEAAVPNIQVVTQSTAPVQSPAPQAPVTVLASKGESIKAPMPGSIINVKVTDGQRVKKGDVIFILEAMKMENEITAPVDGVVVQIVVDKGAAVATGDLLAVIQ